MQSAIHFITNPIKNPKGFNQYVKVLAIKSTSWEHQIFKSLSDCSKILGVSIKEISRISLSKSYNCSKDWTFIRMNETTLIEEEIKYFQHKRKNLNIKTLPSHRICYSCKSEFPLNDKFFHKGKQSKYSKEFFRRICKNCRKGEHSKRYIGKKQTEKNCPISKSKYVFSVYKKSDKKYNRLFDLNQNWILENIIGKNCVYCGFDCNGGIDRIDNSIGHTIINSVPCCKECNNARMNNFTSEEFKIIGKAIRKIKLIRNEKSNNT